MDATDQSSARDGRGRFPPGRSGNPKGRPPGSPNRTAAMKAALLEALEAGEAQTAARVIIDRAVKGDFAAARFLIRRVDPVPRGRQIPLDLPEDTQPGDVIAAYDATLAALVAGAITPDEAVQVGRFLAQRASVIGALDTARARGADLFFSCKQQAAPAAAAPRHGRAGGPAAPDFPRAGRGAGATNAPSNRSEERAQIPAGTAPETPRPAGDLLGDAQG